MTMGYVIFVVKRIIFASRVILSQVVSRRAMQRRAETNHRFISVNTPIYVDLCCLCRVSIVALYKRDTAITSRLMVRTQCYSNTQVCNYFLDMMQLLFIFTSAIAFTAQ